MVVLVCKWSREMGLREKTREAFLRVEADEVKTHFRFHLQTTSQIELIQQYVGFC